MEGYAFAPVSYLRQRVRPSPVSPAGAVGGSDCGRATCEAATPKSPRTYVPSSSSLGCSSASPLPATSIKSPTVALDVAVSAMRTCEVQREVRRETSLRAGQKRPQKKMLDGLRWDRRKIAGNGMRATTTRRERNTAP